MGERRVRYGLQNRSVRFDSWVPRCDVGRVSGAFAAGIPAWTACRLDPPEGAGEGCSRPVVAALLQRSRGQVIARSPLRPPATRDLPPPTPEARHHTRHPRRAVRWRCAGPQRKAARRTGAPCVRSAGGREPPARRRTRPVAAVFPAGTVGRPSMSPEAARSGALGRCKAKRQRRTETQWRSPKTQPLKPHV